MDKGEVSFTNWVKYEIIKSFKTEQEKNFFLFSFLKLSGKKEKNNFKIKTINKIIYEDFISILKNNLKIKFKTIILKKSFNVIFNYAEIENYFKSSDYNLKNLTIFEKKIFISSCFLFKGWINSPVSKFYHLEIRLSDSFYLDILKNCLLNFKINFKLSKINNKEILYIKKSTIISDFLKLINLSEVLLYFEDERILRDMISSVKKSEVIEKLNFSKTIASSKRQIDSYNFIKENNKLNLLNTNQKKIIKLKIENANISLNDLTYFFNKINNSNYSKSTINNWLIGIENIAKDIKNNDYKN